MGVKYRYMYNENEIVPFEKWMDFAVALAQYIKGYSGILKVYISLPEREMFTPFFVFGCVDYDIRHEQHVFDQQRISNLVENDIVCYKENGQWKKMRFLKLFTHNGEKIIELRNISDRTFREVPKHFWDICLCIPNQQRRTTNTEALENAYGETTIKNAVEIVAPLTYISVVKTQWEAVIENISFNVNNVTIQGKEIFKGNIEEYSTISFLGRERVDMSNISQNVIVCDGTLKSLQHMTENSYSNQKQIYIIDRMEDEERIEIVQNNFKTIIRESQAVNKKEDFLQYIKARNVVVPKGVELYIAAHE